MIEMLANFDSLVNDMIFPARQEYFIDDLGSKERCINKKIIHRKDFKLRNKRGYHIECSHFAPNEMKTQLPCVIYLHANGCSRLEALPYVDLICRNNMTLFCFDFSGCGQSQGSGSSIGFYEQEDVECVIDHLAKSGKTNRIALWGRSMGAITSLLFASHDTRLSCLIADSSFASFKQVVQEYTKKNAALPSFLNFAAFGALRNAIIKKAGFDIEFLEPINQIDKISVPILFAAGDSDDFILPTHSKILHKAYKGTKQLIIFEGEHNSLRPLSFLLNAIDFLKQYTAGINEVLPEELQKDSSPVKVEPKKTPLKFADLRVEDKKSMKFKSRPQDEFKKKVLLQQRGSLGVGRAGNKPEKVGAQSNRPEFQFSWLEHSNSSPALSRSQNNSPKFDEKKKLTPKHININLSMIPAYQRDIVADENSPSRPNQSAEIKMAPHRNSYAENGGPRSRESAENIMNASDPNIRKNLIFSPKSPTNTADTLEVYKMNQSPTGQSDGKRPHGLAILKIDLNTQQNTDIVQDISVDTDEITKEEKEKNLGRPSWSIPNNKYVSHQSQSFSATHASRSSLPRNSTHKYITYSPTYQASKLSSLSQDFQSKASGSESPSSDAQNFSSPNSYSRTSYQGNDGLSPQASTSPYTRKTYTLNESIFAKASKNNDHTDTSEPQKNSDEDQVQTCNTESNRPMLSFSNRVSEFSATKYEHSPTSKYQGTYTPKATSYASYQPKSNEQRKLESLIKPYKLSDYTEKILESRQNKTLGNYPDETSSINESQSLCE